MMTKNFELPVDKTLLKNALGAGALATGSLFLQTNYNLPKYHNKNNL